MTCFALIKWIIFYSVGNIYDSIVNVMKCYEMKINVFYSLW